MEDPDIGQIEIAKQNWERLETAVTESDVATIDALLGQRVWFNSSTSGRTQVGSAQGVFEDFDKLLTSSPEETEAQREKRWRTIDEVVEQHHRKRPEFRCVIRRAEKGREVWFSDNAISTSWPQYGTLISVDLAGRAIEVEHIYTGAGLGM